MTAQGEDLLAWLNAAISDRTRKAEAALAFGDGFVGADDYVYGTGDGGPYLRVVVPGFEGQTEAATQHFADCGPTSVLRRCAADRKLLELHARRMHSCPATDETDYLDEWTQFDHSEVCPVVQHLADGYGWTAGQTSPSKGDQVT
ncbi:DUF6221 family protein [Streptomyces griseorubiginosus]|uniref:DUF6221 family protein n=1 Tax=Streptomyces griseorubiginosus TaxID=67304 RepID=UPI0033275B06